MRGNIPLSYRSIREVLAFGPFEYAYLKDVVHLNANEVTTNECEHLAPNFICTFFCQSNRLLESTRTVHPMNYDTTSKQLVSDSDRFNFVCFLLLFISVMSMSSRVRLRRRIENGNETNEKNIIKYLIKVHNSYRVDVMDFFVRPMFVL